MDTNKKDYVMPEMVVITFEESSDILQMSQGGELE